MLRETERTAALLRLETRAFGARTADELERALHAISEANVGALVVLADPILALHKQRIVNFAEHSRLPAMYGTKDFAPAGGLMTYSADMDHQFRGAASYVDKILKGAKPADLPVEQATKFEFVVNMKTAKALGLTIPLPLLGRADEVIE
jgi:putative ABC transport system substrate-binding protein